MPDYFSFADRIRVDGKFFDVSLPQIERDLDAEGGEVEYETEYYLEEGGEQHVVPLRLNLSCKGPIAISWTVSLKLHNKRIDGIDHHVRYRDREGHVQSGWHRHEFDIATRNDALRVPVNGFDGIQTRAQFIGHAFHEMQVLLNEVDHGPGELQFG